MKYDIIRKSARVIMCMVLAVVLGAIPCAAKKYKWSYGGTTEVYTTGQGAGRTQLVKSWAVGGNADKAIEKAKMNAVDAALFVGIPFDASTHGMGVSNLTPLVTQKQYKEHENLFIEFFKKGTFMQFVREVNSAYPTGENNMKVDGGRRVGVNLVVDYPGLRNWLKENGITKGLDSHFKN